MTVMEILWQIFQSTAVLQEDGTGLTTPEGVFAL